MSDSANEQQIQQDENGEEEKEVESSEVQDNKEDEEEGPATQPEEQLEAEPETNVIENEPETNIIENELEIEPEPTPAAEPQEDIDAGEIDSSYIPSHHDIQGIPNQNEPLDYEHIDYGEDFLDFSPPVTMEEVYGEEYGQMAQHPEGFMEEEEEELLLPEEYIPEYVIGEEEVYEEEVQIIEESVSRSETISHLEKKLSPFYMKWCFGMKRTAPIINLTTGEKYEIFFVCSHLGVVYDYRIDKMKFLPGHQNSITSISADLTGRWLTTADVGDDNVIIVWDNDLTLPVWSLYNPFPEGTRCCVISPDARFLAACNYGKEAKFYFWLWTFGQDEPNGTIDINQEYGTVKDIVFNPRANEQMIITTEKKIIFVNWVDDLNQLEHFEPDVKSKGKIGTFTVSVFLEDNHTALSATSRGFVIVWCDVSIEESITDLIPLTSDKKYMKTIRLQRDYITSICLVDGVVVTTALNGIICFHDQALKLLYWVYKQVLDPIASISFHLVERNPEVYDPFQKKFKVDVQDSTNSLLAGTEKSPNTLKSSFDKINGKRVSRHTLQDAEAKDIKFQTPPKQKKMKKLPSDCSLQRKPLCVRDFVFSTTTGRIGYISHLRKKLKYFLYFAESLILSIDASPNKTHFVTGNAMGTLTLYNYKTRDMLLTTTIANGAITCLKYNPSGSILTAGLDRGEILIIDPHLLEVRQIYEHTHSDIKHISFSDDGRFFAHGDLTMGVCLYSENEDHTWTFMGKYNSHYKPISGLIFEENPENPLAPRLFSIGEDRILVEYEMNELQEEKLTLKSLTRVEQSSVPLCMTWHPKFYSDINLIVSNNEHKLRILNVDDKLCRKTTLGPTADEPIKYMKVMPNVNYEEKFGFMFYITKKYLGIKKIPPTGNPFEHMGMIGHGEEIIKAALSYDGNYAFTIGRNDCSVIMWRANISAVEIAIQLGGEDLDPFITLIEGGPNGFLFHEMEDFFYYAQIIHQGEYANLERAVSKYVAICEIPDLLRALGYYPSEYEIENINYELLHRKYEETGELNDLILFDDFVKVYLNHRPVHGVSLERIAEAFNAVSNVTDDGDLTVSREELFMALEDRGEVMKHEEIVGYLTVLMLPHDESQLFSEPMELERFAEECLGIDMSITEENVNEITRGGTTDGTPSM